MANPRLVVLGDINLDLCVDLTKADVGKFGLADINLVSQTRIETRLGGTASLFALAAQEAGFSASIVGQIGAQENGEADLAGMFVQEQLANAGMQLHLSKDTKQATGQILILHLANDRRFMVSDRGANASFTAAQISEHMKQAVSRAALVHISGYWLLNSAQREAVMAIAELARASGARVSLDIVPHKIYEVLTWDALRVVSTAVNIICLELATALRFLGSQIDQYEPRPFDRQHPVLNAFLAHYDTVIVRPNNLRQVIATRDSIHIEETGYAQAQDRRGYLDKVLAHTLYQLFAE